MHSYEIEDLIDLEQLPNLNINEGTTLQRIASTSQATKLSDGEVNCTKSGYLCENCTHVSYCIQIPGSIWLKEPLSECSSSEPCLSSTGNCSTKSNPSCPIKIEGYEFVCYQIGIFPDPYDCAAYHMCIPSNLSDSESPVSNTSIKFTCDSGFGYDASTHKCSINLTNNKCVPVSPSCKQIGQAGGFKQNPSLYYVCLTQTVSDKKVLIPAIFECPNDQQYDGVLGCAEL